MSQRPPFSLAQCNPIPSWALRASSDFPGLAAPRRTKTGPRRNDADMRLSGTRPNALGGWIPSGCPATRWTCTGVSAGIRESCPAGPVPLQGPGAHHCHPSPRAPNATSHGEVPGGGYSPIPPRRPLCDEAKVKRDERARAGARRASRAARPRCYTGQGRASHRGYKLLECSGRARSSRSRQ